jgi:hypothetical protein
MPHPLLTLEHVWAICHEDGTPYVFHEAVLVAASKLSADTFIAGKPLKPVPIALKKLCRLVLKTDPKTHIALTSNLVEPLPAATIRAHLGREQPDDTIQRKFERYHSEHPKVYEMLTRIAREGKELGLSFWGISAVYEVARWQYIKQTGEHLKLANNFRSRYARLIMSQEPDLDGFFKLQPLRKKD